MPRPLLPGLVGVSAALLVLACAGPPSTSAAPTPTPTPTETSAAVEAAAKAFQRGYEDELREDPRSFLTAVAVTRSMLNLLSGWRPFRSHRLLGLRVPKEQMAQLTERSRS